MASTATDTGVPRHAGYRLGAVDPLDGNAPGQQVGGAAALTQRDAEGEVARLRGVAGQRDVAEAGQAHHRFAAAAERDAKPGDLGQPARHQGGAGIVAEPASLDDAAGDGEHVLHGAADLGAGDVVGQVRPEGGGTDHRDQSLAKRPVGAGQGHRGRQPCRHLGREGRAGQDRDRRGIAQRVAHHRRHQPSGGAFDALGADHRRRARFPVGLHAFQEAGQLLRRHGQQHRIRLQRLGGGAGRPQGVRQGDVRQIARVGMAVVDGLDDRAVARPEQGIRSGPRRADGQRRSPGAAAENTDLRAHPLINPGPPANKGSGRPRRPASRLNSPPASGWAARSSGPRFLRAEVT